MSEPHTWPRDGEAGSSVSRQILSFRRKLEVVDINLFLSRVLRYCSSRLVNCSWNLSQIWRVSDKWLSAKTDHTASFFFLSVLLDFFYTRNLHLFTILDRDKRHSNLRYLQLWTDSNKFLLFLQEKKLQLFKVFLKSLLSLFKTIYRLFQVFDIWLSKSLVV